MNLHLSLTNVRCRNNNKMSLGTITINRRPVSKPELRQGSSNMLLYDWITPYLRVL